MSPRPRYPLAIALVLLAACGDVEPGPPDPGDAGSAADAGDADAGARMDASSLVDGGGPVDAASDAALPDPDAGPDAAAQDAGPPDAGPFVLPSSCADASECGPLATCDTSFARCVCNEGALPCGGGCCPATIARDVTLAASGHAPEIGSDAAGNLFVLYERGDDAIRLATLAAGSSAPTDEAVTTCSGENDCADLAVVPDGTLMIAVHRPGSGRSGTFVLYSRAAGATSFSTMSLRSGLPEPFAFDAAVGISRASNGDVYAACSARSGDGTMGLAMTRYDAAMGLWTSAPTILTYHGHSWSELFARTDGYYVGVADLGYADRFFSLDAASTLVDTLPVALSVYDRGQSSGAMTDSEVLYTFTKGRLERSDSGLVEMIPSRVVAANRADVDMATDADGNPVIAYHDDFLDQIVLAVRMPHGGWVRRTWPASGFVPFGTDSAWITLDLERLSNGHIALAAGDFMDRGALRYIELAR